MVEDVFPGRVLNVVEVDDGVAGVDAGLGNHGGGRDVVGDGWTADVLADLVVEHVGAGHQAEGEDEVGGGASERDEHALPAGMVVQLAGIVADLFPRDFTGHLDVSAKGQGVDAVVGSVADEADNALAKADGEGLNADAAPLGDGEVAELVHQHHKAEHKEKLNDSDERQSVTSRT